MTLPVTISNIKTEEMKSSPNSECSLEFIAIKVGVSCDRISFLKKFYDKYRGGSLAVLREAALVNKLNTQELHAIFILVGPSLLLNSRKQK